MRSNLGVVPIIAVLVVWSGCVTDLACQTPAGGEQAVRATHERFQAGVIANDTTVLAELLASDYLFITATGELVNRSDVLRIYGAKQLAHKTYQADSVLIRMLGDDAAIVTATLTKQSRYVAGPRAGTDVSGRFRSTRVYVRRGGRWQVVSTP